MAAEAEQCLADAKRKAPIAGHNIGDGARILSIDGNLDAVSGLNIRVGIYWTPTEFTGLAKQLQHPFDREVTVPPRVAYAMYQQARIGPKSVAKSREETVED